MDTNLKGKKLYKSNKNKMLDGVCAGIGEYFDIDPTVVRLAFVVLCIFAFGGLIAYIVAAIIVPRAPEGDAPKAASAEPKTDEHSATANADPNGTSSETVNHAEETSAPSDESTPTLL